MRRIGIRELAAALAAASGILTPAPGQATSYVPVADEALVDQAHLVAVVRIRSAASAADGGPATLYTAAVEQVLKGRLPGRDGEVTVRVPGGLGPGGLALRIWAAPRFAQGERALLFLAPHGDGTYRILHLMLGAFHEVAASGRRLAVRDLSEAREVRLPGSEAKAGERLRDFGRFVRWVAARARGEKRQADYFVRSPGGSLGRTLDKFVLFVGFDGYGIRWFEFDTGGYVSLVAHETGQQGLAGGGYAEFQTALAAWNADPGTAIDYRYGGTTDATGGFLADDGANTILFNDPNDEIEPFSCFSGGILAIGGPWYFVETTLYQGLPYHSIAEVDVIVNDGLECFFGAGPEAGPRAEEVFGHELGHTLGLAHSEEGEALMRAFVHDDGRGALLHDDDRAGIFVLYGIASSGPASFFTLTPCRLLDTRDAAGPYGGPGLFSGQTRSFAAADRCGVPDSALAISVNVTSVSPPAAGHLTLYPGGRPLPGTSTLNFGPGQTRANNAILALSGSLSRTFNALAVLQGEGQVHFVVDVNGYFQ
jgi:hypothetical protein